MLVAGGVLILKLISIRFDAVLNVNILFVTGGRVRKGLFQLVDRLLRKAYREARPLSANSSFCVAYVEPPLRSFELSEKEACLTECGILESTEPPLNLVESSQRSSLSERVRPFAKTLGLFQLTGAARPLSFFMVAQGLLFLFPGERIT